MYSALSKNMSLVASLFVKI